MGDERPEEVVHRENLHLTFSYKCIRLKLFKGSSYPCIEL
jgi:hypothetical protein